MLSFRSMLSRRDVQANRFELLSRLADDLAHEIKNPLHAMVINLEVMRRRIGAGANEVALERAAALEHEVHRVHQMIDRLLRLLRADERGAHTASVDEVMAELVPLLEIQARLARVNFHYQPSGDESIALLDRNDFKFAVMNLASAVLEPLRDGGGGAVAIAVESAPDEIRVRIAARPALAVLETTAPEQGTAESRDRADSACAMAAELVRDAGGRVARQDREEPDSPAAFLLVLPRFNGA